MVRAAMTEAATEIVLRWLPPQVELLGDGRLHLNDGPIDLVIEAWGERAAVEAAYCAAARRFDGLLAGLCAELPELRRQTTDNVCRLDNPIARRMHAAVAPYASETFITPMAAVAGAVAEAVLEAMTRAASLDRAYVNNGGDIALHLAPGQAFEIGLVDRPDRPSLFAHARIAAGQTGAWHRHQRLARTLLLARHRRCRDRARRARRRCRRGGDGHRQCGRSCGPSRHSCAYPHRSCYPQSDLGNLLVTRDVPPLSRGEESTRSISERPSPNA